MALLDLDDVPDTSVRLSRTLVRSAVLCGTVAIVVGVLLALLGDP